MAENNSFSVFDDENPQSIGIGKRPEEEVSDDDPSNIVITDGVIATVASKASLELDDIAAMSGTVAVEIMEAFGGKSATKGVSVTMNENRAILDLYVIVKYGRKISDIAWDLQDHVKTAVENMTGCIVEAVNVHVQGVSCAHLNNK